MISGEWVLQNGIWYYLNINGDMEDMSTLYQGKKYFFDNNGACTNP